MEAIETKPARTAAAPKVDTGRLPIPPSGLALVLRAAEEPETALSRLSALVEKEPALTAHVLKLSNSAAYGVGRPVRSVAQATILLGARAVRNMAVTQLIEVMVRRVDSGRFDTESFWEHSLRRAAAALAIAELAGYEEPSEAFSAGLIQDLGVLVMAVARPDLALDLTAAMGAPLDVRLPRERELFGEDHAAFFGRFATTWGVPTELVQAIAAHHQRPDELDAGASRRVARLAEILRLGDLVADLMSTAPTFPRLAGLQEAFAAMPSRVPLEPEPIFEKVATTVREMAALLNVRLGAQPSWDELVKAAHALLDRLTSEYEQRTRRLEAELRERDRQLITRRQRRASMGGLVLDRGSLGAKLDRILAVLRSESVPVSLLLFRVSKHPAFEGASGEEWLEAATKVTRDRLAAAVRDEDIVLRVGCDEIAAVLPGCARGDGPSVGARLQGRLSREFLTVEGRAPLRVAVVCTGTSVDPGEDVSGDELLRRAEVMRFQGRGDGPVAWWG